jgi:hypothetical protein
MLSLDFLPFLFTGNAFVGALGFAFTAIAAVVAIPTSHAAYRYLVLAAPFVAAAWWWNLAVVEVEKSKPERDYAYFVISNDPRDIQDGKVALVINATGPLRDVRVAIQLTEDHNKHLRNYIFYHEFPVIAEGGTLLSVFSPPGNYMIDLDAPSKMGKVLEHLQIKRLSDRFAGNIRVIRKSSGEILIPSPQKYSFLEMSFLSLVILAFITFTIVLGWASRESTRSP